jgi:uncharacterized DUF497 family protein
VVISGFEWDDDNTSHIERHEFTPEEVEEGLVRVITARNMEPGERRLFLRK